MILVFGGTTEGRIACNVLDLSGKEYFYSTKGDAQSVELIHGTRLHGALSLEEMINLMQEREIRLVVDAAHPFAKELHKTIGGATSSLGIPVLRLERMYPPLDGRIIVCQSYDEMAEKMLSQPSHRLLALTGVNTIPALRRFWQQRETFFRILDRDDSREKALEAGFPSDHLCYFAEGEDQKLFDSIAPDAVCTKESGESGFFLEKIAPALRANIPVYMITRPPLPKHYQYVYGPIGLRKRIEELLPDYYPLRSGYTTGTTATAATIAALQALLGEYPYQTTVQVVLPSGEPIEFPIERVERTQIGFKAFARKQSGDDPDVTQGAEISAEVQLRPDEEIIFLQGEGVGKVTLPGIGIPVGEPAINATPRRMMTEAVRQLLPEGKGANIIISVANGRELAQKTFNPRLGIEGGISIIGTSGVVKPFSSEAFVASIARQVDIALALGADTIVINSGAKSEQYLKATFSHLPPQSFVQYGNFIGETLQMLSKAEISRIYMGIMLGKAVKLAEGYMDTHSKKVTMNKDFLRSLAGEAGADERAYTLIEDITLARELWEAEQSDLDLIMPLMLSKCHKYAQQLAPQKELCILLMDDSGQIRYTHPQDLAKTLLAE